MDGNPFLSRRQMLAQTACGFGGLALASLSAKTSVAASGPMAAKTPHFQPRAKRVIFLFMSGGPSQAETFDYKPLLQQKNDGTCEGTKQNEKVLPCSFNWSQHGESGLWVSELFPSLAQRADDLCVIRSMRADSPSHEGGHRCVHTGAVNFVRPSIGSWVAYGLGTECESMPAFVTLRPSRWMGSRDYDSVFLPPGCRGTAIGRDDLPVSDLKIRHLSNHQRNKHQQKKHLDFVQALNRDDRRAVGTTPELEGLIQSYELAFRMQMEAPEILDIYREPQHVLDMYGIGKGLETHDFGYQCLMARRLIEAGVRFVELNDHDWDHHQNLGRELPISCRKVDQPIAALLADLKNRGLLEDTVVLWGGEFGRTIQVEQSKDAKPGRGHENKAYTMWLAGGGVKGGLAYGETDELGIDIVKDKVHMHDLHATLLHLLGLDHKRLTYRYGGRDFRLTDVYGDVVQDILS